MYFMSVRDLALIVVSETPAGELLEKRYWHPNMAASDGSAKVSERSNVGRGYLTIVAGTAV